MLRIIRNDIIEEKSELLFKADFSCFEALERDFELTRGNWTAKDGILTGYMEKDGGGLIYSNKSFKGDVLIDFYGKIIPPYDNDLNFTICAKGWNYKKGEPYASYVGGVRGWWLGKAGFEKYPLKSEVQAMTAAYSFAVEEEHHLQAGRVGNRIFLFVDGVLAVELTDKKPIKRYGRVGLGVYASRIEFRDFKVYRPYVVPFETSYEKLRKEI